MISPAEARRRVMEMRPSGDSAARAVGSFANFYSPEWIPNQLQRMKTGERLTDERIRCFPTLPHFDRLGEILGRGGVE